MSNAKTILLNFINEIGGGATVEGIHTLANEITGALEFRVPRLPWDAHFLFEAHVAATRSTCDRGPELLLDPGRHGVGAVFVRQRRTIAGGYNGSPPGEPHCSDLFECRDCDAEWESETPDRPKRLEDGDPCPNEVCGGCVVGGHLMINGSCVRTLHAEENALLQCALDGVSPRGATVYTTAGPCYDCAKRLVRVGVSRVVYGAEYESRYGLSSEAKCLLLRHGIAIVYLDVRKHLRGCVT